MKARLRPPVAALMLLVPGAVAVTAAPATAAQQSAATPTIQSIALNADNGLAPGSVLQFNVQGTPGARSASVVLIGSDITVPLQQDRAGQYRGSYTVRSADRIDPTRTMQTRLVYGSQAVTRNFSYPPAFTALAVNAPAKRVREAPPHDQRAPSITGLTPANAEQVAERGRVHIAAKLGDEGSGVDPASVRLRVNGEDVTSEARVSDGEVHYRERLAPGRHSVEVRVKDVAGNMTTKSWGFDVLDREEARMPQVERMGGGALPLRLMHPGDGAALAAGGNLLLEGQTAPGASVRVQVDAVSAGSGRDRSVADQTVRADREGRFVVSVRPDAPAGPGTRYEVRLTADDGHQTARERIVVHPRAG